MHPHWASSKSVAVRLWSQSAARISQRRPESEGWSPNPWHLDHSGGTIPHARTTQRPRMRMQWHRQLHKASKCAKLQGCFLSTELLSAKCGSKPRHALGIQHRNLPSPNHRHYFRCFRKGCSLRHCGRKHYLNDRSALTVFFGSAVLSEASRPAAPLASARALEAPATVWWKPLLGRKRAAKKSWQSKAIQGDLAAIRDETISGSWLADLLSTWQQTQSHHTW